MGIYFAQKVINIKSLLKTGLSTYKKMRKKYFQTQKKTTHFEMAHSLCRIHMSNLNFFVDAKN